MLVLASQHCRSVCPSVSMYVTSRTYVNGFSTKLIRRRLLKFAGRSQVGLKSEKSNGHFTEDLNVFCDILNYDSVNIYGSEECFGKSCVEK
jgi:hypothetical protein